MTPAVNVLEAAGVEFVVNEYDRHLSGDGELRDFGVEAAEALGLSTDEVFKTLVVVVEGGELRATDVRSAEMLTDEVRRSEMIVAILPVSCQLSMKLTAAAVGSKKATMCDAASAQRSTGYVVGGISPLGQRKQLRTVIDESAELFERIYVSGGRRGLDVGLAPRDLIEVLGAVVAPITA